MIAPTIDGKIKLSYLVDYWYKYDFRVAPIDYEPFTERFNISIIDISEKTIREYFEERNRTAMERYKKGGLLEVKVEPFFLILCKKDKISQKSPGLPIFEVPEESLFGYEGLFIDDIYCFHIPGLGIKCPIMRSSN